ncbi:MAG: enoyl-CoA hydratase/isomerase family protein [Acidobacteria bacterium]|nr:enoyl-CoA hydratase/isomerase family protein [Acidobacteriota bacterium]
MTTRVSDDQSARFDIDGPIAILTFDRPEARNAMTWAMYDALAAACERVDRDEALRVLILRGAGGKAFVAGTDISQFSGFRTREDGLRYEARLDGVLDRLERVGKPTIAQVEGVAAGGGCAIALTCDLCVATPESAFGVPIARTLGNCLSAATCARLVDLIGPSLVKDILFTGRLVPAAEALAARMIGRVAPAGGIEAAVRALASLIAANAPLTLRATKETLRRLAVQRRLAPGACADLIELCYTSEDFREGVRAFLEKRKPAWTGR